jgi:hypothetical protein
MKYLHNYSSFRKKHTLNEKIVDAQGLVDPKVLEYWNGLYDKSVAKTLNSQEEKDYQSMTQAKILLCYGKGSSENPLKKFDQKFLRLKWAKKIIEGFKEKFGKDISEATNDELNEWNYEFAYEVLGKVENDYNDKGKDTPLTIAYEDIDDLKKYAKDPEKYFKNYSEQLNEFLDEIEIPWVEICDSLKVKEVESKPQSRNLFMRFVDWLGKKIKKGLGWIERKTVQLANFVCTGDFGAFNEYDPDMRDDDKSELRNKEKSKSYFILQGMGGIINLFETIGDKKIAELKKSGKIKKLSNYKDVDKLSRENKFIINNDVITVSPENTLICKDKKSGIIKDPRAVSQDFIFKVLGYDFLEKAYEQEYEKKYGKPYQQGKITGYQGKFSDLKTQTQAQPERQPLVTRTWGFDDAKGSDTVDTVWYLRNKYKTLEKTPTDSKFCWQVLSNEVDSWKKLNPGEKSVEKGMWNSLEEIPQFLRKESKKLSPEVIAQYTKLAKDTEAQKKSGGKGTIIKGLDDTGLLY